MFPSSADAFKSLQSFKPKTAQDVTIQAESKYGIPQATQRVSSLRGLVGNLESAVEAVDPSVTGRTAGSFTTEGQRQALVSKERAPILTDLGKQQRAFGEAQSGLQTSQSLASQMASALMSQDQTAYQRLLDQYNAVTAQEAAAENTRRWEAEQENARRAAAQANSWTQYLQDQASQDNGSQTSTPDISQFDTNFGQPITDSGVKANTGKHLLLGNWYDNAGNPTSPPIGVSTSAKLTNAGLTAGKAANIALNNKSNIASSVVNSIKNRFKGWF